MAVVHVVTRLLGLRAVVGEADWFIAAPDPDVEKKYPTGKVGQGNVTVFVGPAVPLIFVIGLL